MRRGFPALPRLFGAADPHPLSCRCFAKEVRSSQKLSQRDRTDCHRAAVTSPSRAGSWDLTSCRAPVTSLLLGWLCHHTERVKDIQRSHTITPARLLMIHLNTKIAQSASCSTQYPQRLMLKRLTFLNQQHEAATPQTEEFSRMSLILKCPIRPASCPPIPFQQSHNISPSFPVFLLHFSSPNMSSTAGRIFSKIQSFPAESRSAPQLFPWFSTQADPKSRTCSLHNHSDRDSSSCWLLAGDRSYLHTPGCCCSCFAPHRGSSSSPSPAAIPGLCPVTAEQDCSHLVPQSKHHFIPFLVLCTKHTTQGPIINYKPIFHLCCATPNNLQWKTIMIIDTELQKTPPEQLILGSHKSSCSGHFRRMQDTLCTHPGQAALTPASSWFPAQRNWHTSLSTRSKSPSAISVVINYDNGVSIRFL